MEIINKLNFISNRTNDDPSKRNHHIVRGTTLKVDKGQSYDYNKYDTHGNFHKLGTQNYKDLAGRITYYSTDHLKHALNENVFDNGIKYDKIIYTDPLGVKRVTYQLHNESHCNKKDNLHIDELALLINRDHQIAGKLSRANQYKFLPYHN